jgi:hypothetical protein
VKAELDPSEATKSTPVTASLKLLGVAFVLFCVVVAGGVMWDLFNVNTESILKVAATFVLATVALIAILFLGRNKS